SRATGRERLSPRAGRRADPAGGSHPGGKRCLHGDDQRAPPPHPADAQRRLPGARSLRRDAVRCACSSGVSEHLARARAAARARRGFISQARRVASSAEMTLTVTLPEGTALELADDATGADAASAIGTGLARAALAVEVSRP